MNIPDTKTTDEIANMKHSEQASVQSWALPEREKMGVTVNRHRVYFGAEENVLKLDCSEGDSHVIL